MLKVNVLLHRDWDIESKNQYLFCGRENHWYESWKMRKILTKKKEHCRQRKYHGQRQAGVRTQGALRNRTHKIIRKLWRQQSSKKDVPFCDSIYTKWSFHNHSLQLMQVIGEHRRVFFYNISLMCCLT